MMAGHDRLIRHLPADTVAHKLDALDYEKFSDHKYQKGATVQSYGGVDVQHHQHVAELKSYIAEEFVLFQTSYGDILVLDGDDATEAVHLLVENEGNDHTPSHEEKYQQVLALNTFALDKMESSMPIEASILTRPQSSNLPFPDLIGKLKEYLVYKDISNRQKKDVHSWHKIYIKNPEASTMQPIQRIFKRHEKMKKNLHTIYQELVNRADAKGHKGYTN